MDPHDNDFELELEDAIKVSLKNLQQPKTQHKEDEPADWEEDKSQDFFTESDLLHPGLALPVNQISPEETKEENLFEETKDVKEELSQNPPTQIDPNQELLQEYLVILEVHVIEVDEFKNILMTLQKLLSNICKDPNNSKFHKIKLNNKKIQQTIGQHPPALFLLELVGFKMSDEEEVIDQFTTQKTKVYVLDYDMFVFDNLMFLTDMIKDRLLK